MVFRSLASVFVMVLVVQFSPGFKETLDRMQDVVAIKIAGGKLISHVQPGPTGLPQGGVGSAVETGAAGGAGGAAGTTQEGSASQASGSGEEGGASSGGSSSDTSFLKPSDDRGGAPTGAPETSEETSSSPSRTPRQAQGTASSKSGGSPSETPSPQKEKKEEGGISGSGQIYTEGDEEGVFKEQSFDWLRLLIILLIIILVAYISFEIYKAIKLGRSK